MFRIREERIEQVVAMMKNGSGLTQAQYAELMTWFDMSALQKKEMVQLMTWLGLVEQKGD